MVDKLTSKVISNLNVPDRKVAEKVNEVIDSGGGGEITVDPSLNIDSTNPVENKQIQNRFVNVDNTLDQHDSSISEINANIDEIEGQIENHGSAISQLQNEAVRLENQKEDRFDVRSPVQKSGGMLTVNVSDIVQQDDSLPVSSKGVNTAMLNLQNILQTEIDQKQDTLTFDNVPIQNSNNPVKSGGLYAMQQGILQDMTVLSNSINDLETNKANKTEVILKNGSQTKNGELNLTNDVQYQEVTGMNLVNNKFTVTDSKWLAQINVFAKNGKLVQRLVWEVNGTGRVALNSMCLKQDGTEKWVTLNDGN